VFGLEETWVKGRIGIGNEIDKGKNGNEKFGYKRYKGLILKRSSAKKI